MIVVKLRPAQIVAFEAAARRRFMTRLALHLRAACREQTAGMTDDALRLEVEAGVDHAARHGIETEGDLQVFLECRLELGPDFDERPDTAWAGKVLRDSRLFPHEKVSVLADRRRVTGSREGRA